MTERTVLGALAQRLGCSEGQLYTMTIGVVIAVVLGLFGLSVGLDDRALVGSEFGAPARSPIGAVSGSELDALDAAGLFPASLPEAVEALASPELSGSGSSGGSGNQEPQPPSPPCDAQPLLDVTSQVLDALKVAGAPSNATKLLLAHLTGCKPSDPVVLALGVLAETGSGLPDPGVALPVVPIPFVEVPQPVIDAVQPFREIIDPTCDAIGASATVAFYGLSTYPLGIDVAVLTGIRTILLVCGQLRP